MHGALLAPFRSRGQGLHHHHVGFSLHDATRLACSKSIEKRAHVLYHTASGVYVHDTVVLCVPKDLGGCVWSAPGAHSSACCCVEIHSCIKVCALVSSLLLPG